MGHVHLHNINTFDNRWFLKRHNTCGLSNILKWQGIQQPKLEYFPWLWASVLYPEVPSTDNKKINFLEDPSVGKVLGWEPRSHLPACFFLFSHNPPTACQRMKVAVVIGGEKTELGDHWRNITAGYKGHFKKPFYFCNYLKRAGKSWR